MTVQARVAFFVILAYLKATEGCDVIQPEIYSSVGEKPSVQIAYTVPASGLSSLQVSKGGISVVSVTYSSGSIITQAIEPIINFTGNLATGDISFHFESVQLENGGKYELLSILDSKTLECVTLTVRGVVTASLSVDKNPAKTKETVVFTCLASSTTSPSVNHTISWSVGAVAVPANSRYSFTETTNISTFTINEVEQVDQGNYVCESTENIPGGGTGKSNGIEFKLEGTTSTSTSTTTTSSSSTSTMASSAAAATSSLHTSTTSILSNTTSTMAPSTATSIKTTSRGTITRASPVTLTVPNASDRDSDKPIVTMIIVVSVIGGVLIVAIFSIMFVMMHWKSCFTRRGHSKQYVQKPEHRKQHRQAEYNVSGRLFTTHRDQAVRGYYFYNGTYKNPLFCDSVENSSYLNNYYPNQKNSHDPKYMSSPEVYQYNYDRDYNWDLKEYY